MSLFSFLFDASMGEAQRYSMPYPIQEPPKPVPEPNWVARHSEYTRRIICHCGHIMPHKTIQCARGEVCPKCGCVDICSEVIGRMEWERDTNSCPTSSDIGSAHATPWLWNGTRNAKWVKKPDVCPHEEKHE